MLVTPESRAQGTDRGRPRRDGRRKKPLLRPLLALQRVLDARQWQAFLFDRVDERFERGGLRIVIAAADERAVAAGLDRHYGGGRYGIRRRDGLHLQIVAENHAVEWQLAAQHVGDDAPGQRRRSGI